MSLTQTINEGQDRVSQNLERVLDNTTSKITERRNFLRGVARGVAKVATYITLPTLLGCALFLDETRRLYPRASSDSYKMIRKEGNAWDIYELPPSDVDPNKVYNGTLDFVVPVTIIRRSHTVQILVDDERGRRRYEFPMWPNGQKITLYGQFVGEATVTAYYRGILRKRELIKPH